MKEVTVQELAEMLETSADYLLIDVREEEEYQQGNIGGDLIPMGTVPQKLDLFPKDEEKIIVMCRSGNRSGRVIGFLEQNHQYENLYNLKGGILAWRDGIDETIDVD